MTTNTIREDVENEVKKLQKTAEKRRPEIEKRRRDEREKTIIIKTDRKRKKEKEDIALWGDKILDQGFTLIPNALIDHYTDIGLKHTHMAVITAMMRFAYRMRKPFPAQKTLSQMTGLGDRTIQKVIKELKQMGYLTVQKRYIKGEGNRIKRTSNVYNYRGVIGKIRRFNGDD